MPFSRGLTRVVVIGLLVVLTLGYFYKNRQQDATDRSLPEEEYGATITKHLVAVTTKAKRNNTAWIYDELADWPSTVYVADDPTAPHHAAKNKGNEANMYLQWIIDNYASLPAVVVFVHDHNHALHVDPTLGSNAQSVRRLRLERVLRVGYQNLRCTREPHCVLKTVSYWNTAADNWGFEDMWATAMAPHGAGAKPETTLGPCCAQFAVSADAIRRRPRAMYQALHRWLMDTELPDSMSGRIFEYSWHVIFGMRHVLCTDQDKCYCETYGLCEKNKTMGWFPDLSSEPMREVFIEETISE